MCKAPQADDKKVFAWFHGNNDYTDDRILRAVIRKFGAEAFNPDALAFMAEDYLRTSRLERDVNARNRLRQSQLEVV